MSAAVALALGLAVIVGIATWGCHGLGAVASCTVIRTVLWSVDAATVNEPCLADDASLWPVVRCSWR